jgi:hypothetical protein
MITADSLDRLNSVMGLFGFPQGLCLRLCTDEMHQSPKSDSSDDC